MQRITDGTTHRETPSPSHTPKVASVAEAAAAEAPITEIPPEISRTLAAVLEAACIACRGVCCQHGREHAYITSDTILGYLDQHPGRSIEEIVDAYMAPIRADTMEIGCVYQHNTGCSLPRRMRSITCNTFYCESLVELQQAHHEDDRVRAFFAPESAGHFVQGVFADGGLVTLVHRRVPIAAETRVE